MKLKVPATTTNFGAGFDTFGLAVELYNVFEINESDKFGVEVEGEGKDLPRGEDNLLVRVYKRVCEILGVPMRPFFLRQKNEVPVARGLGSSATAIVGGIEIALRMGGERLTTEEKLKIAYEFEPHPDNLLPAMVGGFVVCATDGDTLSFIRMSFPKDLTLVFAVPDFKLSTEEARKVLPESVSLKDAVFNLQRGALFVVALKEKRYSVLKESVRDRLHQRARAHLVQGFERVLEAGYSAGAYAVFLSGAGPTVCALSRAELARKVGERMREGFAEVGTKARVLCLRASELGAHWVINS